MIYISFGTGVTKDPKILEKRMLYIIDDHKVVILIDEYDKPILDNIEDVEIAKMMRENFKNFYSVIKDADPYMA